jgi:hypothetical protein
MEDRETRAGLLALAPQAVGSCQIARGGPTELDSERIHTLGQWAAGPGLP